MSLPAAAAATRGRRPVRLVALLVALVATLALLCCGGTISAFFLGGLGDEDDGRLTAAFGCGEGGPVDPDGKLPRIGSYGLSQIRNAAIIINVGAQLEVPPRGWVIAVATALQESGLKVYANDNPAYPEVRRISLSLPHDAVGRDHDSVGLFQQRPVEGDGNWGTVEELMAPETSARKFYQALLKVDGWQNLPLTLAAQKVQVSAYPDAYAKHEPLAMHIVNVLADGAARAVGDSVTLVCATAGRIAASGWTVPVSAIVGSGFRTADRPNHHGVDLIAGNETPIWAAASGIVQKVICQPDNAGRISCNEVGYPGKGGCGWYVEILHADNVMTRYCHMIRKPIVRVGQMVSAGQEIGRVGSSGDSSGPHLHFEVHLNNDGSSAGAVNPVAFMRERGAPLGGRE